MQGNPFADSAPPLCSLRLEEIPPSSWDVRGKVQKHFRNCLIYEPMSFFD
jgi:hypothetical protein